MLSRVMNGTATGRPLPYQVGLSTGTDFPPECGGSLIASRVVLTAAHCYIDDHGNVFPDSFFPRTIRLNMYDILEPDTPGVTAINLSSGKIGRDIFPHPHYNGTTNENDVALLILPVGVEEGENIKYAKLNEDPNVPAADERLFASGWGKTKDGDPDSDSHILLGTVLNYFPDDDCYALYKDKELKFVYDMMMCAYKEGTGTCEGDSGGPLVIASQYETAPATEPPLQVGIVSFKEGERGRCKVENPTVFTRVSSYVDWITSTACKAVGQLCPPSKSPDKSSKASKSKASKSQRP